MSQDPTPQIPHYRVLRTIGEGGMGLVYEAEQVEPVKRRVALKVLKVGMDTKAFVGRFEAERQALAVMDHINIARVYDAGATAEGRPYYTMEYVPGVPLTDFCDEQRLGTRARIELMVDICAAVHHAHQKGIIHRDLKPSNILVTLRDDRPVPKVIDFGIAKALTGRLTERTFATDLNHPIGTAPYMSPEQWDAGQLDLDTRSDIYSLGVILYELLVGTLPHDPVALARAGSGASNLLRESVPLAPSTKLNTLGDNRAFLAKVRNTDPGSLSRELKGDLDWITLKALAPERTRRYETVHGLSLDLGRYLRSEPVLARSPSARYRLARFVRRHRVGTVVGAMLVLMAAGFTVVTAVQSRRIARERDAATVAAARADALNEFLQQTLLSPDPVDGLGRDATMMQALDVAAERLRSRPLIQPEADAAMKSAIGWAYYKLGSYDRAKPLLLEALAKRRGLQADPLDLAESLLRAAALYDILAEADSAAPLYQEALGLRRQHLRASDRPLAETLIRSGSFFRNRGDSASARSALMEALDIYRRATDAPGVAEAETHLGQLEYGLGHLQEAERYFASALAFRRSHYGDHPLVAEALVNEGAALEDLGRVDEAEAGYREGLRIAEKTMGTEHDLVTATLNNLALLLGRRGRVAEAESLFGRAIAADERKLGREHPDVGIDLFNLADLSCRSGDPATGATSARRAIDILAKTSGSSSWEAAMSRVVLGRCLTREKKYPEAETNLLQGLHGLEQALGPSHRRVDSAKARLAELYAVWRNRN